MYNIGFVTTARLNKKNRIHMGRSEEHTSELQSQSNLVCRLLLEKKKEDQRAQVAPVHVASRVVVGIDEVRRLASLRLRTRHTLFRDEGLDEPRRLHDMPLARTPH